MTPLVQILIPAIVLALLDAAWFSTIGGKLFGDISSLLRMKGNHIAPDWFAGIPVYFLLALGLFLFVRPHIASGSWAHAALWGGVFGFIVYGVYECTNKALLKGWTWQIVAVDILWGTFACAIAAITLWWVMR